MDNGFLAGISYVDLIIASGLLLFIIIGIIRGFTSDGLGLLTWFGAFFIVNVTFPFLQPFIRTFITEPFFADIVLGFLTFVISLIILVFIVKLISKQVHKSVLSGLDRTLGIVSGFFRGTALLTVVYFLALMFWKPGATPEAFQQARLIPYINTSAKLVHHFLIPDDFFPPRLSKHLYGKDSVAKDPLSSDDLVKSLSSPKAGSTKEAEPKAQTPIEKGYKNLERKALENLIDHIAPKSE
ncbi:MAG TPA: hypothetical protein DD412_07205 [Holosporales bacterium]|nr:hypothetical protein [Holosporales bacterium]